jgi:hypothetical protein
MANLRELISGSDVPPAVRLRGSLAILQAADMANRLTPQSLTFATGPRRAVSRQTLVVHTADRFRGFSFGQRVFSVMDGVCITFLVSLRAP